MSGSVSLIDGHIDPDKNRMTDKEIIKALECCKMPVGSGSCNDCPFDYQRKKRLTSTDKSCTTLMFDYALDLINRQQAEIEKLNVELVGMRGACNSYKMHYDNAKIEIERLTINMNAFGLGMKREKERADTIRAEAIKEYKEKLKEHAYLDSGITGFQEMVVDLSDIENIADEMVGEDK